MLKYTLFRYCGQPEVGNRPTVVRSCYDIATSSNIIEFLTELGCRNSVIENQ